jgi:branched-chain amino acid aminotransferase
MGNLREASRAAGLAWVDGALVADPTVGLGCHALHYGTAVMDGTRFYRQDGGGKALFRLRDHLERFLRGAGALGFELRWTVADLAEATRQVVARSGLEDGYVRQLAFAGEGTMGLGAVNPVRVAIMAWEPAARAGPLRLRASAHGPRGPLPEAKLTGPYLRSYLARREAIALGADDAVFLAADGTIAEATAAAVFAVRGGELHTPGADAPALESITGATTIDLAAELGVGCRRQPLRLELLLGADEVFLASSAGELRPVGELEDRRFEAPGPITAALRRRFAEVVRGRHPRHLGWLEAV